MCRNFMVMCIKGSRTEQCSIRLLVKTITFMRYFSVVLRGVVVLPLLLDRFIVPELELLLPLLVVPPCRLLRMFELLSIDWFVVRSVDRLVF